MCRVGRSTKKSVAALTARQYRETKKMEFERLKSQLEMFKDAYYHYKQLYEKSQLELKAVTERCFMLEQTSLRNSFPMPSDPALCCGPICLSPSESCDLSLAFNSDLTYESWEDPDSSTVAKRTARLFYHQLFNFMYIPVEFILWTLFVNEVSRTQFGTGIKRVRWYV